jgi:hypothetical protein
LTLTQSAGSVLSQKHNLCILNSLCHVTISIPTLALVGSRFSYCRCNANAQLFQAISGSAAVATSFYLNSQESISSDYIFVRPKSSQFNYSENPSFISGSTGEVLYSDFINNPQTYITTIGLYNDTNQLLAVAKLSRPLPKNFTTEALVRVKLDF